MHNRTRTPNNLRWRLLGVKAYVLGLTKEEFGTGLMLASLTIMFVGPYWLALAGTCGILVAAWFLAEESNLLSDKEDWE